MRSQSVVRCLALSAVLSAVGLAQNANPLAGMWLREHAPQQPPEEFILFGVDGQFAQAVLPGNRPQLDQARRAEAEERHQSLLGRMTKEELVARFQGVEASHGAYTVSGNVISQKHDADLDPNLEGTEQASEFRLEGKTLILTPKGSGSGRQVRLERPPRLMEKPHPLLGTWIRFFLIRDSTIQQPPATPEWVFFGPDGYFLNMEIRDGRPRVDKPLSQMTKEELLRRFNGVAVTYGAYSVQGNISSRKHLISMDPGAGGFEQVRGFRFEGDVVNFRGANANGTEMSAYFERPK